MEELKEKRYKIEDIESTIDNDTKLKKVNLARFTAMGAVAVVSCAAIVDYAVEFNNGQITIPTALGSLFAFMFTVEGFKTAANEITELASLKRAKKIIDIMHEHGVEELNEKEYFDNLYNDIEKGKGR